MQAGGLQIAVTGGAPPTELQNALSVKLVKNLRK
jgi:hypothetical protein